MPVPLFPIQIQQTFPAVPLRRKKSSPAVSRVVEILSPSTSKRDRIYKKKVYEECGVREYWIVNPVDRSVEQYVLEDGQLILRDVFQLYPDFMLQHMTEEEKTAIVTEFQCTLFDDLTIRLENIFHRVIIR